MRRIWLKMPVKLVVRIGWICATTPTEPIRCVGGLRAVTLPTGRLWDPKNPGATYCPNECSVTFFSTGDHYLLLRAHNARGAGLTSGVVRVNFPTGIPAVPENVFLRGYTADPLTDSTAKPKMEVRAPSNTHNGGTVARREYSWKVGNGPWSGWATQSQTNIRSEPFNEMTFRVGETYTFRYRQVTELGVGYVGESMPFVFGAPPLPGADKWNGIHPTRLLVLAVPSNGQVRLNVARFKEVENTDANGDYYYVLAYDNAFTDPEGTNADTVWQYSYRPVGGEWSPWAVANTGERFARRTADSTKVTTDGITVSGLRNGVAYEFRVRGVNRHGTNSLPGVVLYSNGNGAGLYNKASQNFPEKVVIPGVNPPAPSGLTATGGDGQVSLSWTSAGSGGPPIIRWEYRKQQRKPGARNVWGQSGQDAWTAYDGEWTPVPGSGPSTTSAVVKGLTNGRLYRFQVRAVNALADWVPSGQLATGTGNGAAAQSLDVVPGQKPQAPPPGDGDTG